MKGQPAYDKLELVVEPTPPSPVCRRCGDPLPDYEWTGLCDQCVMRSGNAFGIILTVVVFAIAVALFAWYVAAPRPAPDPTAPSPSLDVAGSALASPGTASSTSGPGLIGAPQSLTAGDRTGVGSGPRPAASGERTLGDAPLSAAYASEAPSAHSGEIARYTGKATWYCSDGRDGSDASDCPHGYGPNDLVAAIDRKDSPFRKGDRVEVRYSCGSGCLRAVRVTIVDTCACGGVRLIDLTSGAFRRLAPLGAGVIPVTIVAAGAGPTLPPTDVEP